MLPGDGRFHQRLRGIQIRLAVKRRKRGRDGLGRGQVVEGPTQERDPDRRVLAQSVTGWSAYWTMMIPWVRPLIVGTAHSICRLARTIEFSNVHDLSRFPSDCNRPALNSPAVPIHVTRRASSALSR